MNSIEALSEEQLEETIDWCEWELQEMEFDERTSTWYGRRNGLQHMLQRFRDEVQRREKNQRRLELFGSLSLESRDPDQLSIFPA